MPVLTPADPTLPALGVLADPDALATLLRRVPWLDRPRTDGTCVRLRWKPGTNLRAGLLVPHAGGTAALLVADFGADTLKAEKFVRRIGLAGTRFLRDGTLVVAPADADPALCRHLPPGLEPLSYNPDRRFVGRDGRSVVKVHAVAPDRAVRTLAAALHGTTWSPSRVSRTPWVSGRAPVAGDAAAVAEALREVHRAPVPPGLPVLDAAAALAAARRAAQATVQVRPVLRDRVRRLLHALEGAAGAWPRLACVVHGDLSRDQVVITDGGRGVLLDLDRAALGPPGWDGAVWGAAEIADAAPDPVPPPVGAAPVLRAAALVARMPEPFRRLRADWPARTDSLVTAAEHALELR